MAVTLFGKGTIARMLMVNASACLLLIVAAASAAVAVAVAVDVDVDVVVDVAFVVPTTGQRRESLQLLLVRLQNSVAATQPLAPDSRFTVYVANDAQTRRAAQTVVEVVEFVRRPDVSLQHVPVAVAPPSPARVMPLSVHLAAVFRWLLQLAFDEPRAHPHTHVVVLEDDLMVAPDIAAYFVAAAAALDAEPDTLLCASAWNDNGFGATANDAMALYRGEHFMGMGWMVARAVYERVLRPNWPSDRFFVSNPHFPTMSREWDDFVRNLIAADRLDNVTTWECIYPEVSRTHHTLDTAAAASAASYTTSAELQSTRFDGMALANVAPATSLKLLLQAAKRMRSYDDDLQAILRDRAVAISSIENVRFYRNSVLVFICPECSAAARHRSPGDANDGWNRLLVHELGLLSRGAEGIVRGIHQGVVVLNWVSNRLLLVAADSAFAPRVPAPAPQPPQAPDDAVPQIGRIGDSCSKTCVKAGRQCDVRLLPLVNDCDSLTKLANCPGGCERAEGKGYPAVDHRNSMRCVRGWTRSLSCDWSEATLQRLCVCVR